MIRISLHPCVPSSYHRMRFRTTPNQFSRGCQWKLRRAQSLLCSSQPNYKQRWVQTTLDTLVILSLSRWYWKRVMNNQHRSSIPNLFRWAWCTAARLVCRQEVAQIGLNGLTALLNQNENEPEHGLWGNPDHDKFILLWREFCYFHRNKEFRRIESQRLGNVVAGHQGFFIEL